MRNRGEEQGGSSKSCPQFTRTTNRQYLPYPLHPTPTPLQQPDARSPTTTPSGVWPSVSDPSLPPTTYPLSPPTVPPITSHLPPLTAPSFHTPLPPSPITSPLPPPDRTGNIAPQIAASHLVLSIPIEATPSNLPRTLYPVPPTHRQSSSLYCRIPPGGSRIPPTIPSNY